MSAAPWPCAYPIGSSYKIGYRYEEEGWQLLIRKRHQTNEIDLSPQRILAVYEPEGREFESLRAHHSSSEHELPEVLNVHEFRNLFGKS
jgi:hypothetical protein